MMLPRILSLRQKLLLTFLSLWLLTVVIATLAAYWFSGNAAQISFDRILKDDALALAAQIKWESEGPRFGVDTNTADLLIFDSVSPPKFTVLNKLRQKIAGNAELPLPNLTKSEKRAEPTFFDMRNSQGNLRVVSLRIDHQVSGEWVWVLVGEAHSKRSEISHELAAAIFLPAVGLAFVIIPLLLAGIKFGLSPAKQISEAVAEKDIDDLSPVSLENVPEELRVVILHINDLLMRLQQSVAHERRFVADAAHQLRTPIAGIKILAEDLLRTHQANTSQPPNDEVLQELNAAATRAAHLVRQLLSLARAERTEAFEKEIFDIQDLIGEVITQWQRSISAAHKTLRVATGMTHMKRVQVQGSRILLEEALGNIIDNAIRYGGKNIQIDAKISNEQLVMSVTDDGEGLKPDVILSMLTPFWRGEGAADFGVGLGLPIAQKALQQMHGVLSIKSRPEVEGTAIVIELPIAEVSPSSST